MEKIEGNLHELMKEGAGCANFYLSQAIESIDRQFGEGYAKKHPQLISGFMITAAMDNQATVISKYIQDTVGDRLGDIHKTLSWGGTILEDIKRNI